MLRIKSLFLDARGGVYSCGTGSGGALGHGDFHKQDVPMKIMKFGTFFFSNL